MLKLFEKRSIIYLWVVAYSIMLITPIIANLYVFNNIHMQLKYEMHTRNQYFFKNMSKTYDGIFSDVNRISMEIQRDEYISNIAKMESLSNETRYIAASAIDNLSRRKLSSQYITDIFVYFPKLDLIITSDSIFESYTFFKSRIIESDKSYEEWKENLNSGTNKSILNENIIRNNDETEEAVGFIEPIKKNASDNGGYIINVYIEKDKMFHDIEEFDHSNKKAIFIINSRNEVLFQYGEFSDTDLLKKFNFKNEYKMSNYSINNSEFGIAYVKSSIFRYKYVYVTSENIISKKIGHALTINIVVNLMCLVLLSIFIGYFTKWNYGKISLILESLTDSENSNIDKYKNEYMLIKEKIEGVNAQRQNLKGKIESQNTILKNGFLADYLKGYSKQINRLDERLSNYGISFKYKSFVVVAIYINDYGVMEGSSEKDTVFIIKNIISDLPLEYEILWIEMDGTLYGIVNIIQDNNENYKPKLKFLFESACDLAYKALELNFSAAMSSKKDNFENIPDLYNEAISALEYSVFYEVYDAVYYDDIKELNSVSLINYSNAKENALIISIKTGNKSHSEQILNDLFSESVIEGHADKLFVKAITYNIVNVMMKVVNDIDDADVNNIFRNVKYFDDLENCRSATEFKTYLFKILEKIFEGYKSTKGKSTTVYDKVRKYVDENFKNSDLYVASVGEHFNMSALYLSRIFKECSGVKLSYYINTLRINYAKVILKDDSKKIDDIAKLVGYENTRTFLNAFKKREGITPTQFKNNL